MKIGPGVSELWGVENCPFPLTRPMAYTTACTTVQAVTSLDQSINILISTGHNFTRLRDVSHPVVVWISQADRLSTATSFQACLSSRQGRLKECSNMFGRTGAPHFRGIHACLLSDFDCHFISLLWYKSKSPIVIFVPVCKLQSAWLIGN